MPNLTTQPPSRFKTPAPPAPPAQQSSARVFKLEDVGDAKVGQRVLLYGPGGIGKTTLACLAPGPVGFIDVESSLEVLKGQLVAQGIVMPKFVNLATWADIRAALQSTVFDKCGTIVIDSATKLEDLAVAHCLATVKGDKNSVVRRLEDYGFGKGYQHVFEIYLTLLGDLDRHTRAGRNVILIAHDCVSNVPNPQGGDWERYEPRLQSPKTGKASIRLRVKEWSDHTVFYGYDVAIDADTGKAKGCGSRRLYTAELPFCMAKSRTTNEQFEIEPGVSPWDSIIK